MHLSKYIECSAHLWYDPFNFKNSFSFLSYFFVILSQYCFCIFNEVLSKRLNLGLLTIKNEICLRKCKIRFASRSFGSRNFVSFTAWSSA